MEQYLELREHIKKHCVPQAGDSLMELDKLRDALGALHRESYDLMNFCVDRGYILKEDETQGFLEWQEAMSNAEKLLYHDK